MKQFFDLQAFPADLPSPVVTIGNFDGVHLGHQIILKRVIDQAHSTNGCAVVITFDPHPLRILLPESAPQLIMTPAQKLKALADSGIDYVLVLRFSEEVSRWSPRHFVERTLGRGVSARKVFVGTNFVFGYQQRGTFETLQSLGAEFGFEVEGIPQFTWRQTRVSSTLIRGFIREGKVADANRLLGRYFEIEGTVTHGTGRGHVLTVPTLNLQAVNELIPKTGVYVTHTSFDRRVFNSVTNVGIRPTFGKSSLSIESHLIEPPPLESPERISISFLHRLRDEKRFASAAELKSQIVRDVQAAKQFFRRLKRFTKPAIST